jgi:hypothetical protein
MRPTSEGPRWSSTTSSSGDSTGSTEDSLNVQSRTASFSGRTAWARSLETPLREFLRTETGGAVVLLAAAVAALVWVNVDASSYDSLWGTTLSIDLGGAGVALDLRHWVNSGLMTFFFVVGLEARREFDLGELRERRRFALPLLAGIGGMAVAVAIYLAFNAGRSSAGGWGIAMSTDTAFALGLLALVGPRFPDRLRAFMLTVVVVDDIVALVVIATVYTETLRVVPLLAAIVLFGAVLVARSLRVQVGLVCAVLGAAAWVGLLESGVEPVVIGLAMGLLAYAFPASRSSRELVASLEAAWAHALLTDPLVERRPGLSRSALTDSNPWPRYQGATAPAARELPARMGRPQHEYRRGASIGTLRTIARRPEVLIRPRALHPCPGAPSRWAVRPIGASAPMSDNPRGGRGGLGAAAGVVAVATTDGGWDSWLRSEMNRRD